MANLSLAAQQTARWTGRVISALATAFWLLILLDIVACDALVGFICLNWEMAYLVIIVVASILSVILAWRDEGVGGFVMLVWGSVFTTFAAIDSNTFKVFSTLVSGVPFLIAGFLFLVSWWSHRVVLKN